MLKVLRLIAVVVLDDVGTMGVCVMFLKCRLDMWLWRLSRLRYVGRCDGVRRVVNFLLLPVEIVRRVGEVLPFVCLRCLRMGSKCL